MLLPKNGRFFQLRNVSLLEKQIEKMDAEYDKCNEVMAKGEISGFDKSFLGNKFNFMNWFKYISICFKT